MPASEAAQLKRLAKACTTETRYLLTCPICFDELTSDEIEIPQHLAQWAYREGWRVDKDGKVTCPVCDSLEDDS